MPFSDYFVATVAELDVGCRGWRVPLATPTKAVRIHPFTGNHIEVEEFDPAPGAPFPNDAVAHVDCGPLPHVGNSVDIVSLEALMCAALGVDEQESHRCDRPARLGPPWSEEAVCAVPTELVEFLARMSDQDADSVVARWTELLGDDAETVLDECTRNTMLSGITEQGHRQSLDQLRKLAREGVARGRQMYCVMGP